MHTSDHITVLLAEDNLIVREGICSILKTAIDIKVVGQAHDGREAVKLAKTLHPDVIVMDIAMPLLNGLEATRRILKATPSTRILMLSAHTEDAYVEQSMALGAAGYFFKQPPFLILAEAIRTVCKGNTFYNPSTPKRLRDREKLDSKKAPELTPREVEVLQLITEGNTTSEAASELGISIETGEKHRRSLLEKLNFHDITGLTRYALAEGIIESGVQLTIV